MSRQITLPPENFRIHPWRDDYRYFAVYIADNHEMMKTWLGGAPYASTSGAVCMSGTRDDDADYLGALLFYKGNTGVGIVAHELTHAAFRACERRVGTRFWRVNRTAWWLRWWAHVCFGIHDGTALEDTSVEERCCYAVERMNKQFWNEMYGRGLAS